MIFSLSTVCTHLIMCGVMLLLMRLVLDHSCCLGKAGFSWLMLGVVLLAARLLLPFEWSVTKSIPVSPIYPAVTNFLNRSVTQDGSFELPLYWLLLSVAVMISVMRIAHLLLTQRKYAKYLDSLPDAIELTYTNRRGRFRKARCVTDPSSTNALAIGLIKPQIVMPAISFSAKERELILHHELSHIIAGDMWIKFFVEIICALYWWVPFIGTLRRQTAAALELRADHSATRSLNEREKLDYLACLLKVMRANHQGTAPLSVGFTTSKNSSLKARFMCVMAPSRPKPVVHAVALLLVVVLALSFFVVFEPYDIPDAVLDETFGVTGEEAFLLPRADQGYDLYVDGTRRVTITDIPEDLLEIPIIDNLGEVAHE